MFYVYTHQTLDGKIFYVGKGSKNRIKSKASRSKEWREIAKNGFVGNIIANNLTEVEAYKLERETIGLLRKNHPLLNKHLGGGPIGNSERFCGKPKSKEHAEKLAHANKNYNYDRYEKSSLTLSIGDWSTPNGTFHSLRLAAQANGCTLMTVRNRCLGFIAKRGSNKYPVAPKDGWSFQKKC